MVRPSASSALAVLALAAFLAVTQAFLQAPAPAPAAAAARVQARRVTIMRASEAAGAGGIERRGAVLRSLGLSGLALAVAAGVAPLRPAIANVGEGE